MTFFKFFMYRMQGVLAFLKEVGCCFVCLTNPSLRHLSRSVEFPVRVKGGMSLWNGMWHGLRNDIIMRNVIYAE